MTTTAAASMLHRQGPFSLDRTREFVHAWPPLARYAPVDDEPLRLGTVLDGQHTPVVLALTQARPDGPVAVEVAGTTRTDVAVRQAARMLALDHDARGYPDLVRRDPALGTVMARRPGLRPTLFGSPYEAACWAVISARMPVTRAGAVLADLGDAHGATREVAGGHVTCFPDPATLLGLDAAPGLSAEKVRRLHDVAEATLAGRLEADDLRALGSEGARAALQELPPRISGQPGGSRRSAPDPVGAWCLEGVEPGGRDEGRGAVAHVDLPVAVVVLVVVVGAEQDQVGDVGGAVLVPGDDVVDLAASG